ncbi:MAG: oxidoreductase [Deltaproteobacteria bacterium]|nr:oxidoreductase [Deltaproteobacteria bacterium]
MKKWSLIIDIEKCEDCNNCFLSCKDEYVGNDWPGYTLSQPLHGHRWMNIMRKERGQCPMIDVAYLPIPCMHCDNAPCIKAARDNAVYKRNDGIVIIDPEKAKGQKDLLKACPYDTIWWNEEKDIPQKCLFCAHLLDDGWEKPRCVQSCPTGALRVIHAEDSEIARIVESEKAEVLHPEYQTRPRVFYKNLYRYFKCFIAGSVAVEKDGVTDCAEGANVTLLKDGKEVAESLTDNYGDFKFDRLEENSGPYTLEIFLDGYEKQTVEADLKASLNLGSIYLDKGTTR